MKSLATLETIVKSLSTSETNQFRKYLTYKNKKRAIRLLETVLSYQKSKQTVDIEIFLQRKKFGQKTTRACNELLQLFNKFFTDNPPSDAPDIEAVNLMFGARTLLKKGLVKEAIQIYEQAKQEARKYNLYYIEFECVYKISLWSRVLHPKNVGSILEEFNLAQSEILEKISDFSESIYLIQKSVHLLQKGVWCLKEKDKAFLLETQQRAEQIIKNETLDIEAKIQFYSILSTLYQYNSPASLEKSLEFAGKAVELVKSLYDQGLLNRLSMLLVCIFNYHQVLVFTDRKDEIIANRNQFRQLKANSDNHSIRIEYHALSLELITLHALRQFDEGVMDSTKAFFTLYDQQREDVPYAYFWDICFSSFEIYLMNGDLKMAELYCERLLNKELRASILVDYKLYTRLANLILQFELNNLEFVGIEGENIRRLYSGYFDNNPCSRLVIKYMIKLANFVRFDERKPIYEKFKLEIEEELADFYNKRIFLFSLFPDWIDAKLKKLPSINSLYLPISKE